MYSVANAQLLFFQKKRDKSVYVWYAPPTFSVPNVQQEDETGDTYQFLIL